jgi:carboxypeptidase Taq
MENTNYTKFKNYMQSVADLKYASAVLQWDQETYMPVKGAAYRGRQITTLATLAHQQMTDPILEEMVTILLADHSLSEREMTNVSRTNEDIIRSKKLPSSFVKEQADVINICFHSWVKAREQNDFQIFEPHLQKLIALKRREAAYLGFEKHPYDALMNDYDKGLTTEIVDTVFEDLKPALRRLIEQANNSDIDDSLLRQHFDKDAQWQLGIDFLKEIHYDFEAGRQDISAHPFTTNFSAQDVRVTTRINENDFTSMLWSCIHEGGHALYEQGLPADAYGLPMGEYCSLSIHESQSRLWENCIGRSLAFWKKNYNKIQTAFPDQFLNLPLEDFYAMINKVAPSLVRTEADELTYHFHVIIRYEIEKTLIAGEAEAKDIPAMWSAAYKNYLGVEVPSDAMGCLQDIHWSHGSFGYFATYSIGSLYAAQLWSTIQNQYKDLEEEITKYGTESIWNWLKEHIYKYGRQFTSEELCRKATGEGLNSEYFIKYAEKKWGLVDG